MSIYSRNRTGVMEMSQTKADMSYGVNDFGRILYEIQQNDMAFFEAILQTDFKEIKSLNEGTILESEVAALNEASKNQLIQKIKESIKKFIANLKGIIKNAIDNIANYTVTKYAELVNTFAKIPTDRLNNWDGKITIRTFNLDKEVFRFNGDEGFKFGTSAEICGRCLHKNIYGNVNDTLSASEFTKLAIEKCATETTYDKSNIVDLKNSLKAGKKQIAVLKETEKIMIATVNSTIRSLETRNEEEANALVALSNGWNSYIACLTRATIAVVRNDMKSRATGMVKAIASINKTPKELKEAYILEAAEDFDTIMNGEFNQGLLDDEARAEMENLLKAAE